MGITPTNTLKPLRSGIVPARGCGGDGGTEEESCAPCEKPNVATELAITIPGGSFSPPSAGDTCTACLALNGNTFIVPKLPPFGSPPFSSCSYGLTITTCLVGVTTYDVSVIAGWNINGLKVAAGLFNASGLGTDTVGWRLAGAFVLGGNCLNLNLSLPYSGRTASDSGCVGATSTGNAQVAT